MILEVEGILIDEKAYGETSKIVYILTQEYGVIGCLSKGSRMLKSNLRSISSKLTYGKFYIYYKKDKLSILSGCDVIDTFKNIKKSIEQISYASYLLELTKQVEKQTSRGEIFNFLISSLKKIDEGFDPLVITNILELKYLEFLGVMPILDSCSICGRKTGIVTLSSYRGGYLCNQCRTNEFIVDSKTIKLIRMFYYVDISKIEKLEISDKIKREINHFLDDYYDHYTGLYLKSKDFLKHLNQLVK